MSLNELIEVIKLDLNRYDKVTFKNFLRYVYFTPGFKYSFRMRVFKYLSEKNTLKIFKPIFTLRLKSYTYKYGIQIPLETSIGSGLLIRHFGGIFINPSCKIGNNLLISQDVTIGVGRQGVPTIGDNVSIAPGAKIIGRINIGNNVVIAANSVVIKEVCDNAVVGGIPAKVLYYNETSNII